MPQEPPSKTHEMIVTEPLTAQIADAFEPGVKSRIALIVYYRNSAEMALLFQGNPVVVGRALPSTLRIPDKRLSREHARFSLRDTRILVEDLGSTNGTWIQGRRIKSEEIEIGDEVLLGHLTAEVLALGSPEDARLPVKAHAQRRTRWDFVRQVPQRRNEEIVAGPAMQPILEKARLAAASRLSVILHGETGTGKEVLARIIHESGPRQGKRMVNVNCGAIPAQLVESTLFGHERGAFSSAVQQQKGVFEEANGGTVFLDEIGELPLPAQVALLRVLETGRFSRVGSPRELSTDVQVIAATHRDLEEMARQGSFRFDLYYRLNVLTILIPPLRERKEEIEPLMQRFLRKANETTGRHIQGISQDALGLILAYSWPGNVRQLKNAIDCAVAMTSTDTIQVWDLPPWIQSPREGVKQSNDPPPGGGDSANEETPITLPPPESLTEFRERVQQYEKRLLVQVLRATSWNRSAAAQRLGMPLRTLSHKIRVLGIKKSDD
jgi:two-component system response regulator AtoC